MHRAIADLHEAGVPSIRIKCGKCGHAATYNIDRLLETYGNLPVSLLVGFSLGCERRNAADPEDPCKATYAAA